jgi:hypothetical protein
MATTPLKIVAAEMRNYNREPALSVMTFAKSSALRCTEPSNQCQKDRIKV